MNVDNTRYGWIDSLKGLSILGVVMIHSGSMAVGGVIGKVGMYGSSFVQAFFVISAFLAWKSLGKSKDTASFKGYVSWIGRRLKKLAPQFYIAIILYAGFLGGNRYWAGDINPVSLSNIVSHLLFIHGLFPKYCNSILGVEWYIGVLALFYLIAPLLYRVIINLTRAVIFFVFIDIACYYGCRYIGTLIPQSEYAYIYSEYINGYCVLFQLPTLSLGIILYYLLTGSFKNKISNKMACVLISLISIPVALCILKYYGVISPYIPVFKLAIPTLYAVAFFVYMIGQDIFSIPILNNRFLGYLGRHSYGIYLFHVLTIFIMENITELFKSSNALIWLIKYILAIVLSLLISCMIEKCGRIIRIHEQT